MTLIDKTTPGQVEAIAFEVDLPHTPAKVWRALTDPALLEQWLLPVIGFKAQRGTAFTFKTQPPPGSGWDGVVHCTMLEFEPHKKISWRWVVGDIDTVVTFTLKPTLTPTGEGARLSIVQSGFKPDQKQASGGARYGWKMMGGKLVDLLARLM